MRIVVCIKQVPDTTEVAIDTEKGILKREGVDSRINPYDLYALETALRLKEELGGEVIVISMGPPQAQAIIKEAYAMGADIGLLLSDRKFAGADTAQVGPGIAEYLHWPHISYVTSIIKADLKTLTVTTDMSDTIETQILKLPALITVAKDINQPRLLSYKLKLKTENRAINIIGYNDLTKGEEEFFGLDGSPTQVERIFPPQHDIKREIWQGNAVKLAQCTIAKLKELRYL